MLAAANTRAVERVLGGAPTCVLEVGAGPGYALAELVRGAAQVVGLDLSAAMLRRAGARLASGNARAALVRGDALRLPFRSNAFDAVMCTFLLDLLREEDLTPVLSELARVLAPGGRAVLGVLELPNPLLARVWMTVYRIAPDALGGCRPVDLTGPLSDQRLRLIRDERLDGWLTMRIATLVKVSG